eukprot:jgi/Psemu1/292569/fgenesh1_pg.1135_\
MIPMINDRLFAATMLLWTKRADECSNLPNTKNTALSSPVIDPSEGTETETETAEPPLPAQETKTDHCHPLAVVLLCLWRTALVAVVGVLSFAALYYAASSPPLHWYCERAPAAGPSSVYVPGGGFSGFWFHLGYLHALAGDDRRDLHDYDYYCYSAGCLSVLSVFLNRSLEEVYDAALASQNAWNNGTQNRFEIVDYFFEQLVPPEDDLDALFFLPRIKILVTTASEGYRVLESRNRNELKENIRKTTWVPYLTGWGWFSRNNDNEVYLDGGFSRVLHPRCEVEWNLPLIWETLIHTFSPGLSLEQVQTLWKTGYTYRHFPLPSVPRRRTPTGTESAAFRVPGAGTGNATKTATTVVTTVTPTAPTAPTAAPIATTGASLPPAALDESNGTATDASD